MAAFYKTPLTSAAVFTACLLPHCLYPNAVIKPIRKTNWVVRVWSESDWTPKAKEEGQFTVWSKRVSAMKGSAQKQGRLTEMACSTHRSLDQVHKENLPWQCPSWNIHLILLLMEMRESACSLRINRCTVSHSWTVWVSAVFVLWVFTPGVSSSGLERLLSSTWVDKLLSSSRPSCGGVVNGKKVLTVWQPNW